MFSWLSFLAPTLLSFGKINSNRLSMCFLWCLARLYMAVSLWSWFWKYASFELGNVTTSWQIVLQWSMWRVPSEKKLDVVILCKHMCWWQRSSLWIPWWIQTHYEIVFVVLDILIGFDDFLRNNTRAVNLGRFKVFVRQTRAYDRARRLFLFFCGHCHTEATIGWRCTYLIVDLMFTQVLLQLALSGKDLRAYGALLLLELPITETFCFTITRLCILSRTRESTLIFMLCSRGLTQTKQARGRYMMPFLPL